MGGALAFVLDPVAGLLLAAPDAHLRRRDGEGRGGLRLPVVCSIPVVADGFAAGLAVDRTVSETLLSATPRSSFKNARFQDGSRAGG